VQTLEQYSGSVSSLLFTPTSQSITVASYSPMGAGHVDLVDARFPDVRTALETTAAGQPTEALSSDGRTIAIGSLSGTVDLLDISSRQLLRRYTVKGEVLAMVFSPNAKLIAVATGSPPGSIISGSIIVFRTESTSVAWSAECHGNAVLTLAFSPDGRSLLSGGNDSWLRVWDAASGTLQQRHEAPTIRIATFAFSHDGKLLAMATEPASPTDASYNVLVYDFTTWKLVRTLTGHRGRVTSVAYSPDGEFLASGGLDATLRLWRLNAKP